VQPAKRKKLVKNSCFASVAVAALTLALAGGVAAEQPKTPFVSGDEPMNVGQGSQLKAPTPDAKAQEATDKVLKQQAEELSGDYPVEKNDAQIKDPVPNAKAQEATEKALEKEDATGAISGKYK
jgi:hypothetical protein